MSVKIISEKAKLALVDEIKRELANSSYEQHNTAAYGFVGVYNMNEEQLFAAFKSYNIDPYA